KERNFEEGTQKMRPKIFLFGDSITEESFSDGGWGASLADLLRRKNRWPQTVIVLITPPPVHEEARLRDGLHLSRVGNKV
ncbi:unnamed protein product, partial [Thlaspi arvense]